ncbi:MAG: Glycosyl transferase group 1 [Candidatus Nomurabacteria bacterium GW2011_GWB1_47_6]|uniref:Glycosyl transferase group 1 n=1 Tax=Candidatus Nomurabacteria bacterium GW2011_GWB1_47_6 TaxID=1618749 RepID=A0A0G1T234_9BACT|nr:MAG: Glycosyl transferase group 1 [Candidatus Nomurabacteria bacterium GW2011_GWB1_47_6]
MSEKTKKILVVSSYAPPSIGGPQMLYNLLKDFPADSYSVLTSYYNIDDISAAKGTWLAGEYVFYDNPKGSKEARKAEAGMADKKRGLSGKVQKLKLIMKRISFVRVLAGMPVILAQVFAIVRSGRKAVKKFQSEIILGISDYGPAVLGSYVLHKITGRPLYLFMFDLYKGNFFPFPGGLLATLFEKKIFKSARLIIVNNEGTRNFYQKFYGEEISKKIVIVHNSIFPETYQSPARAAKKNSPPYTILFTGRVNWPQLGAIKNLVEAVNGMDDVIFKLYSPMPKEHINNIGIFESKKVQFSFAPPQDMPKVQSEADILFLPLSWRTQSQAIIDTATPGKLTDYLIAGKPMLVHAPASSFLVKYATENNFASVVAEENIESLRQAIRKLISDEKFARELVDNAQVTFERNHDANKSAAIFRKIFSL